MEQTAVSHVGKNKNIEQLRWPLANCKEKAMAKAMEPEQKKIVFPERWLQDVQWLETNDHHYYYIIICAQHARANNHNFIRLNTVYREMHCMLTLGRV